LNLTGAIKGRKKAAQSDRNTAILAVRPAGILPACPRSGRQDARGPHRLEARVSSQHPLKLALMRRRMCLLFVVIASVFSGTAARAADEDGLLELWKQHMATPDDHDAAIKACRDFSTAHAGDPLLPVVRGIEEWHTLRAGKHDEAFAMFEADLALPPSPLNDGARRIAFAWMTRKDREKVAAALQAYYRKEIAYPKTLEQIGTNPKLKSVPPPPLNDRFGKPWNYALTGFEKVKGFEKLKGFADQKYSLRSAVLGDLSDIKSAEKLPYAARISAVPQQVIPAPGNLLAVKFNLGKTTSVIGAGTSAGDLHLAFVGTKIIVVCDYTHWKLFLRP